MGYRSRERVAQVLSHQAAQRVPYDAVSGEDIRGLVEGMDLDPEHRAFCLEGDFRYLSFDLAEGGRDVFGSYLPGLPDQAWLSCWGFGRIPLKSSDGHHAGHKYFHPLAEINSVEQLERYPFPDFTDSRRHHHLAGDVQAAKTEQYTVIGGMSQTILETAYLMRGLERLMVDFYERPGYVEVLFGKLAECRVFQARKFAEAGVDILRIGDDIATQEALMVSPALYCATIKPLHAAAIAAARQINPNIRILYHSDGNLTDLLPDLIEIGVDAINPVQPECMNLEQIKREFGRDLTLWGCTPVQSVYANGSGEDVLNHIRFLMEKVAPGGGLVLQFMNMIVTPRVLDNLRVFLSAFYEMGRYG